jgi:hypothetical protein
MNNLENKETLDGLITNYSYLIYDSVFLMNRFQICSKNLNVNFELKIKNKIIYVIISA